jgi:hypothetical protein
MTTIIQAKLSPETIDRLLNALNDPTDTVVCHMVPTRAFRVIMRKDRLTFRVEQLSRQAGDKWLPLSTHKGDDPWESYGPAWNDAAEKQKAFLMEMRKLKVAQNQKQREAGAGVLHVKK